MSRSSLGNVTVPRAPGRDVVTLGADDEYGQSNVLQGDPAAVEFEAAFSLGLEPTRALLERRAATRGTVNL